MKVIHSTKIYYFDVDRTPIFTRQEVDSFGINLFHERKIGERLFYAHIAHLELIRDLKARGHTIVIWSAGGAEWAATVCQLLGLSETVDLVISKPDGYCDDKRVEEWMSEVERFYLPIGNFNGNK